MSNLQLHGALCALGLITLGSAPALANTTQPPTDVAARIDAIEAALALRRAEMTELERQLAEVRRLVSPPLPRVVPQVPDTSSPPLPLTNSDELNAALLDPNSFFGALEQGLAGRLTDQAAQPVFDRPNLTAGLSAALTFGDTSNATINYSLPFILRNRLTQGGVFAGFQPRVATVSLAVTTPLTSRAGLLASDTERRNRANLDIPNGTSIRIAFDFLSYPTIDRDAARRRVVDALYTARTACFRHFGATTNAAGSAADFHTRYATTPEPSPRTTLPDAATVRNVEAQCSGNNLVEFIVAARSGSALVGGPAFIDPALPRSFLDAFWGASTTTLPQWGWGASFEIGTTDFTFSQAGDIRQGPNDEGREAVTVNPAGGFAPEDTQSQNFLTARAYGLYSWMREVPDAGEVTRPGYLPGITFVGSAEYSRAYAFRPGTSALTICPARPVEPAPNVPGGLQVGGQRCSILNAEAPLAIDGFTLAAEARLRLLNIPLVRTLSFAPRYSHRVDDGQQMIDIPVYLQNDASGFGTAGLRFRHRWGGRDVLGNDERSASEVSIFFVPLRFNGL